MKQKTSIAKAALAVKAIFLICGLAISSWAPMVPFSKSRLGLNDADLGLLLLCLGAGAIPSKRFWPDRFFAASGSPMLRFEKQ